MRLASRLGLVLAVAALGCANTEDAGLDARNPGSIELERLAWLAGTWTLVPNPDGVVADAEATEPDEDIMIEERWSPPAGGTMLATGRTISGGSTVFFEFLRIEARRDDPESPLVYVAQPGGRWPGTEFPVLEQRDDAVVFANPEHDFPRRIEYRRLGRDRLRVVLDGAGTAVGPEPRPRVLTYVYERVR